MFDEAFVRAWRLYLAGSQAAFVTGSMQLFQVVFARGAQQRDSVDAMRLIAGSAGHGHAATSLIVGGGPAGSTCAWRLRQAGLDVIVVGRRRHFRATRCAPAGSRRRSSTALRLDTRDVRGGGRTFQPITGFRVGLIGGRDATRVALRPSGQLRHPPLRVRSLSAAARRRAADARRAASRASAGTAAQWIVNDAIRAPLLVGAGGSCCPVARMIERHRRAAAARRRARSGVARRRRRARARSRPSRRCRSCSSAAICKATAGACAKATTSTSASAVSIRDRCRRRRPIRRIPRGDRQDPAGIFRGGGAATRMPSTRRRAGRMIDDGVVLIGDAAGVADPQSGEGIRQAIESGLLAADTIVEARGAVHAQTGWSRTRPAWRPGLAPLRSQAPSRGWCPTR